MGFQKPFLNEVGADWFLPSKDELYQLYLVRATIGGLSTNAAGYWCSSENNCNNGNTYYFGNGSYNSTYKTNQCYVRAIRTF